MSHITLIRHGQANTGARDEASYDRLSPLGHQQAQWLGQHLRDNRLHHTRVYCGTLTRHLETAQGMGVADNIVQDHRLNELEYFTLSQLLEAQQGITIPEEREGFIQHLPQVFGAWQRDEINNPPESWTSFHSRVQDVMKEIRQGDGPALVVTSGGLISMVMQQAMGLDIPAMARIALAIMNSSMHQMYPIGDHLTPVLFNAVPHLDVPDRHHAKTHF